MARVNVLVLMGVSGSGKTTVGKALAKRLGWQFIDADDFHPPINVNKMRQGLPLTDADRIPWLGKLHVALQRRSLQQSPAVLACSALKTSYRQRLSADIQGLRWVYLKGSVALLRSRLLNRTEHFMPVGLLQSQLDTLEVPTDAFVVSIEQPPDAIVQAIIQYYGLSDVCP